MPQGRFSATQGEAPAPPSDAAFKSWYATAAKQYNLPADPDAPGQFYDYRAAFKAGAKPDASGHWPSDFKKAGHPNEVVGGFNTRTGERVPGTPRAKDAAELVRLGWDRSAAEKLVALPEPKGRFSASQGAAPTPPPAGSASKPLSWDEARRQYDAGTIDAAQLDMNAQAEAGQTIVNAVGSGPVQVGRGALDISRGNVARGARDVLAGGLKTAAVLSGPGAVRALVAAPLATTAALVGGAGTAALVAPAVESGALALGASEDQAGLAGDVAGVAGGAVGGVVASKVTSAVGRAMTEVLPERLYGQIFKTAEDDLRRAYMAQAKGRPPDPSLARQAIEEGIVGSPEKMAVYSLEKLAGLESDLQAKAGREILVMPDKQKYVAMLTDLEKQFTGGFFSTRADEARGLITALQSKPGPLASATDMLAVKRYLDGLRNTSSFKLDPSLTQKQEELKIAADRVRATLHRRPALSALIDREKTFIRALDAVVDDAAKRGNRQIFGLVDAVLTQAGPAGLGAAVVRHGAMAPSVMTGLAQGLTRAGRRVGAAVPTPPARAAGAGVVGSVAVR